MAAYYGALVRLRVAFGGSVGTLGSYVDVSGVLTDELQANSVGAPLGLDPVGGAAKSLDSRSLPEQQDPALEGAGGAPLSLYRSLQQVRGQAEEARGMLRAYGSGSSPALLAHLYAVEGYSELLLADLFCSGIPLSTVDFDADYTYRPGSTTDAVYQHAVTLFDSALALAADSARIMSLARLGTGRAYLALGRYADAAAAVASVPDQFQYAVSYAPAGTVVTGPGTDPAENFAKVVDGVDWLATTADREGGNGLEYRSSADPRTLATLTSTNQYGTPLYHPDKYATDASSPIVLADWVEARLIEAEAALQGGDVGTWLGKLNYLRETAITPALPDTTDPGTADGRVDLLFRERAFWLYLTGHRQGDLRRLVRRYGRDQAQVYPTGSYPGGSGAYGSDVTVPVPAAERQFNPKFTGCVDRGA
jgi:tetratricopeptide (TPR) repeat protein